MSDKNASTESCFVYNSLALLFNITNLINKMDKTNLLYCIIEYKMQ